MLIRNAVEAGHVDEAVRRVNELEPEVSIVCLFHVWIGERSGGTPKITTFHAPLLCSQGYGDPETIYHRPDMRGPIHRVLCKDSDGSSFIYVHRANLCSIHQILDNNASLLFHLQLQSFIELIRHDKTQEALRFASEELAPRGAQNPEFLAELEKTMALLAFPELASFDRLRGDDVEDDTFVERLPTASASAPPTAKPPPAWSTLGSLMRKEHRTTVAKELNAAILDSQGQGQETKLSGLVKLMAWTEEALESKGLPIPGVDATALLTMQGPSRVELSSGTTEAEPMTIG